MTSLIGMLMFGKLSFVAVLAYINARTTMRMKGKMPKSTLAKGHPEWRKAYSLPSKPS